MIPVKYGSGYNLAQLEQAARRRRLRQGDGSVVIHQGGVEMGQGLTTRLEQVASYVLNVPFDLIRIEVPDTSVIPNPTSTGRLHRNALQRRGGQAGLPATARPAHRVRLPDA